MEDVVSSTVAALGAVIGLDLGQTKLLIIASGLACLGLSFHGKKDWMRWASPAGWVCVGIYFFLGAAYYMEMEDPVLIFMSLGALPVCIAYGGWEALNAREGRIAPAVEWLRGAVFWSAMPYLMIEHIPMVNAAVVWFTAWNASLMLQWTGAGDITLGAMMVDTGAGDVLWSEWTGNRWLLTDSLGEGGFFVPMVHADGTPVNIAFVLGCSALQSMIVFIGALVAVREATWQRRLRAIFITIPVIHVLNTFRNAGIIWMHVTYAGSWDLGGLSIFEFGHSYAAKFLSLGAMFLMALALFELLPKLHSHVLDVLDPLTRLFSRRSTT
jgi:archaeosortase A (PGF-CTERM-specific)